MKTKSLLIYALLFILTFTATSCKKKVVEKNNEPLEGSWEETPSQSYPRRIVFDRNGQFSMKFLGTDGYPQLTLNGIYTVKGDSLLVKIRESLEKQDSGNIIKTTSNIDLFDKGTFNIKDFVLTINYLSYPADGPVPTQIKFNKILPID